MCLKEPLVCLEYLSMVWMGSHLDGKPLSPSLTCSLFIYLFDLFPVLTKTALTAMSQVTSLSNSQTTEARNAAKLPRMHMKVLHNKEQSSLKTQKC